MKEALIEYETLDSEQVGDLMARRTVRPPKDWHKVDNDTTPGNGSVAVDDDKSIKDGPIGGTANEH